MKIPLEIMEEIKAGRMAGDLLIEWISTEPTPPPGFYDEEARRYSPEFKEKLGKVEHGILINPQSTLFFRGQDGNQFVGRELPLWKPTGWPARCRPATIS